MDMLGEDADIQAILGRDEDFAGMENDTLPDFTQLEHFINSESDEQNNYFADTLANQEASRHSGPLSGVVADVIPADASLMVQQHQRAPVMTSCRSAPYNPSIRAPYNRNPSGTIHFNANASHAMPESPPDSASEPPYSPSETNRSGSSIGGSPLNDHCSGGVQQQQRYVLPTSTETTYGALFSSPLDLKNELVYTVPPPVMAAPCGNAATPTIYTIEDHGGLSAPSNIIPVGQKKRKLSLTESFSKSVKQEPQLSPQSSQPTVVGADEDYSYEFSADSSMFNDSYQCIRFQAFQQSSWHLLFDRNLKELPLPNYRIDADKGFNFSNTDEAFVCQKKNHFQITCHVQQSGEPYYVKSEEGLKKVDNFYLHFFGVKAEAPTQMIRVEQSQSDRSKKPFHPVLLELQQDQVSKITVGRLHFNETTANNMRKKGKPNPDQRFFNLVVSLQAHCGEETYTVVAHSSERIIVRASNPGMFENEVEQNWQRGTTSDSVFHSGRVGINTDRPDEALVVHGNLKITGHLVQPSDRRAKEGILEADTKEQLRNVQALRVVHYKYTEAFAETAGLKEDERADTGVIAQEVECIIPDAVRPAGNIILPDGRQIENFLVVNKERIFMENVGAVKELCKVTDNLENRIDELERMNHKFSKLKRLDSIRSSASGSTGKAVINIDLSHVSNVASSVARRPKRCGGNTTTSLDSSAAGICANRFVQAIVIILVMIMALCLIAMATLYILEWQKRNSDLILAGSRSKADHHTVLNYTEPSLEDYAFMSDAVHHPSNYNQTLDPAEESHPINNRNSSGGGGGGGGGISTIRSIPLRPVQGRINGTAPPRSFTSLTSAKPDPVGKPGSCPASNTCQVYCCAPLGEASTTTTTPLPAITSMSARRIGDGSTTIRSTDPLPSSQSSSTTTSATEMLTNNVDYFNLKDGKSRNFRGPSDAGSSFDARASLGQLLLQKPRDKKPIRVSRVRRHLSTQQRDLGSRGPTSVDFMSTRTRTPSVKVTPTQPTVWDGRVSYIRLVGAAFNVTLGPSYCMSDSAEYIRCLNGDAANYTYGIPLSRHMPDRSLTLQFHFTTVVSLQPDQCTSPVRLGACADGQRGDPLGGIQRGPTLNHADSVARTFFVDVGRSSIVAYRLRFPVSRGDTVDLCEKPSGSLGDKFVEYNLVFYRVCDD